ncbi:unnamed protein product [[Candida] boidinii]|nr:unnamed protein product [[Candida] boidinii]
MTRRSGRRSARRSEGHPRRSSRRRDENRFLNNNNQINSENNYNIDDEFVREKDPNEYNNRYNDDTDNEIDSRNNNINNTDLKDNSYHDDDNQFNTNNTELIREQNHSNIRSRERRSKIGRRRRSGSSLDPSERQESPIATIHVKNFRMGTTVAQLSETFSKYGELSHIILLPPPSGGVQCYAYIAFKRVRFMEYALADGKEGYIQTNYSIGGGPLIVEKAKSVPKGVRHSSGVKILWENYIKREKEMTKDNRRNKSRRRNGDRSVRNSRNTSNENHENINNNNNNNNNIISEYEEKELVNGRQHSVGSRKRRRSQIDFDDEEEENKYGQNDVNHNSHNSNHNNEIIESQEDRIDIDPFTFYYHEKVQSSRSLLKTLSNGKSTKTCNIVNQLEDHHLHNNKNNNSRNSSKRNSNSHLQTDYYNSDDDYMSDKESQRETTRSKSTPHTPRTPHTPHTPHAPHTQHGTSERSKCICGASSSYFDDLDTDGSDTDSLIRSFKRFKQRRITARQERKLRKLNSDLSKNNEELESLNDRPPLGPPSCPPPEDDEYEIISDDEEINTKDNNKLAYNK